MVKARVKSATTTPRDIDAFIEGGGSAPARDDAQPAAPQAVADAKFTWRYAPDLQERIKASLATRPGKVSLNTWLIEAAIEKLEREGK